MIRNRSGPSCCSPRKSRRIRVRHHRLASNVICSTHQSESVFRQYIQMTHQSIFLLTLCAVAINGCSENVTPTSNSPSTNAAESPTSFYTEGFVQSSSLKLRSTILELTPLAELPSCCSLASRGGFESGIAVRHANAICSTHQSEIVFPQDTLCQVLLELGGAKNKSIS